MFFFNGTQVSYVASDLFAVVSFESEEPEQFSVQAGQRFVAPDKESETVERMASESKVCR